MSPSGPLRSTPKLEDEIRVKSGLPARNVKGKKSIPISWDPQRVQRKHLNQDLKEGKRWIILWSRNERTERDSFSGA